MASNFENILKNPLIIAYVGVVLAFYAAFSKEEPKQDAVPDKIAPLESRIDEIQRSVTKLEIANILRDKSSATLQTNTEDYSLLNTGSGNFLISTKDVRKYANGYKIDITIGNPNFITFTDVAATVEYGPAYDEKLTYQQWQKSLKSTRVNLDKPILPATWNKFVLTIAPAKEEDLGYISLKLDTNKVMLSPDYRQ